MFAEFGDIQSAYIHAGQPNSTKGYVSFKTPEAAKAAIETMDKKQMPNGSYLLVSRHISKRENQVAAQGQTSNTIQSSMRKTYESNLFVKNIPSEIKEEEITNLFQELGPVISIKLRKGKFFNPNAAYRQYFILYKDIDSAKRAIQRFDQSTPFGARPLSVQFWMPTQELHQEREQRCFQEVQQYFTKTILGYGGPMQGVGGQDQRFAGQGGQFRQGGNYQQRGGPNQGGRQGGKYNRNGPGGRNVRQGGNRGPNGEYNQQNQGQAPANQGQQPTPEQQAMMAQQQQQQLAAQAQAQQQLTPEQQAMMAQQ